MSEKLIKICEISHIDMETDEVLSTKVICGVINSTDKEIKKGGK